MAEHGRGAGGRHAVGPAAPTAPIASATAAPSRPGPGTAGPATSGSGTAGPGTAGPGTSGPGTSGPAGPAVATPAPPEPTPAVRAADPGAPEVDDADGAALGAPVRGVGWVLLVGGLIGSVVALVLTVEKLDQLANPNYIPSCSIDPVLSCGTIMKTAQASVVGFPNPVVGLLTYPVVAACGALLLSRVGLPRWVWWALQLGTFAGVLFIHWLIVQSLVVIHALCPYCMVAWAATIALFWFTTMHNLREGNLGGEPAGDGLVRRHGWGLAAWYLLVVVAIVASFPAYFGAMVGLG